MDAQLKARTIQSLNTLLRHSNYRLMDMEQRLGRCAKRDREGIETAIEIAGRQKREAEAVLAEIEALS